MQVIFVSDVDLRNTTWTAVNVTAACLQQVAEKSLSARLKFNCNFLKQR